MEKRYKDKNWLYNGYIVLGKSAGVIGNECMNGGVGEYLSVHHIDYNKENNNMNNLITLCHSCHSKTNFDREKWIEYFKGISVLELDERMTISPEEIKDHIGHKIECAMYGNRVNYIIECITCGIILFEWDIEMESEILESRSLYECPDCKESMLPFRRCSHCGLE